MKIPGIQQLKEWFKKQRATRDNIHGIQQITDNRESPTNTQHQATTNHLSELVLQKIIPGMAISIYRGGRPLFQQGVGYADLENETLVDPGRTLFRAASVSKPITACALATLLAEGKIDLDASFYRYVSYFPEKKYDFTLRQLAAHTAGIRGYMGKEYALNKPYSIRDSLVVFQDDPLLFEPGTQYHYNSFDHVLLSLAIEEVTGLSFSEYTREKVLHPLGMIHTKPESPETFLDGQALYYTRIGTGFRKATPVDNRYKLAGGGYLTTAEDIIKLGRAILEKRFYPEEMAAFLEPQSIMGKSTYYGLCWEVSEDAKGRRYFGHIGNQVGGYSYFKMFPETGLIAVALVNCSDPKIQELLNGIVEEFQIP